MKEQLISFNKCFLSEDVKLTYFNEYEELKIGAPDYGLKYLQAAKLIGEHDDSSFRDLYIKFKQTILRHEISITPSFKDYDFIVSPPSYYSFANNLAELVSSVWGIKNLGFYIIRVNDKIRATSGMSYRVLQKNWKLNPGGDFSLSLNRILIVDDVYCSGNTVKAMVVFLRKHLRLKNNIKFDAFAPLLCKKAL